MAGDDEPLADADRAEAEAGTRVTRDRFHAVLDRAAQEAQGDATVHGGTENRSGPLPIRPDRVQDGRSDGWHEPEGRLDGTAS